MCFAPMLGRWKLVFRQTVPFESNPANNWDQAKSLNPLEPNFSILGQVKNFRSSSDNTFHSRTRVEHKGTEMRVEIAGPGMLVAHRFE